MFVACYCKNTQSASPGVYRDGVMTSSHVVVICPEPSRLLPIHMVGMQSFQMSLDCRERVQMTLLVCSNDFRIFTATEDTNKDQYVREPRVPLRQSDPLSVLSSVHTDGGVSRCSGSVIICRMVLKIALMLS